MRSDFHARNILSCLLSSYLVHRLIHFGPVLGLGQFWVGPVLGWASFGFGPVLGWASFVWASFGYGPVLGLGQFCLGQFWSGQLWGASYVSASSVLTPRICYIRFLNVLYLHNIIPHTSRKFIHNDLICFFKKVGIYFLEGPSALFIAVGQIK